MNETLLIFNFVVWSKTMGQTTIFNSSFNQAIAEYGFDINDDALFLTSGEIAAHDPEIRFHVDNAKSFGADAIFLRKQLNGSHKPQVYLYDFTSKGFEEQTLTSIQKKIWSSGEVPIICAFYDTEVKIINCTTHINDDGKPEYLFESLKPAHKARKLYNEQFAIKIKSGIFWEEEDNKNRFEFKNSSYDKLIDNIRFVIEHFKNAHKSLPQILVNKIIIQSILIKYLEERIDDDGGQLLSEKFFKKYNSSTFNDVLRNGKFIQLLDDLNDPTRGFNGNVFEWKTEDKDVVGQLNLSILADLLDTNKPLSSIQIPLFPDWRYFEFKYIPVELISRLYEEFLASTNNPDLSQEEQKKKEGTFYTPAHLVKLLVDEVLPLKKFAEIDLQNYTVLDPACGSGIFLVIAFKRLVQIWRLQNNLELPSLDVLKSILRNIYGVDKEEQAIQLASFSLCLALCNELKPIEIITKLKFDDLRQNNIINSDFFNPHKLSDTKFNLVIGNPPFVRGGSKDYGKTVQVLDEKVEIPSNQLALKFLLETYSNLKPLGLQCLIVKSSSLIYNSSSNKFKQFLFSNLNVLQVLDFTALGRNNSLWDGADVASAAMFIREGEVDLNKNILHVAFRRTKATKERIVFEIDDYDLHFINRQNATTDKNYLWKNNLLGGGRIKNVIERQISRNLFRKYLDDNDFAHNEGYIIGTRGTKDASYLKKIQTIPTEAIREDAIDYSQLDDFTYEGKLEKVPEEIAFIAPNIIIWENIGHDKIPVHYNEKSFSFKDKIISIASRNNDKKALKEIAKSFSLFSDFYRFFIFTTSSQLLVNLNTAILKDDYMSLPYIGPDEKDVFSEIDKNVISDVNTVMQLFLRNGERSAAVKPIKPIEFKDRIELYGNEFSRIFNLHYKDQEKSLALTNVITLNNSFIAVVLKYQAGNGRVLYSDGVKGLDAEIIAELSDHKISEHLSSQRIIKLYPKVDTILLIKPNQLRYWIALTAYRDADKCLVDYINAGY